MSSGWLGFAYFAQAVFLSRALAQASVNPLRRGGWVAETMACALVFAYVVGGFILLAKVGP